MFVVTFKRSLFIATGVCESVIVNKWKIMKIGENDGNKNIEIPWK